MHHPNNPNAYSPCLYDLQVVPYAYLKQHLFLSALLDSLGSGVERSFASLSLGCHLGFCFGVYRGISTLAIRSLLCETYQPSASPEMPCPLRPSRPLALSLVPLEALPCHLMIRLDSHCQVAVEGSVRWLPALSVPPILNLCFYAMRTGVFGGWRQILVVVSK